MSLQFEKLRVPAAYEVVWRELRRIIIAGELRPGDHLPSETELAEQFGVNRSTVREGIRQLQNDGFVRRQGRKRLCVCLPTSSDLAPRASRAMVMHQVTFRELWEVAMVLEPVSASLCARNKTVEQADALRTNVRRTRDALDDASLSTQLDTEFHAIVATGAHNKALLLAREPIGLLLYPAFEMLHPVLPQAIGRMLQAHERIAAAIGEGDAAGAEIWMRKHIADFRRGWEMVELDVNGPVALPGGLADH